MRSSLVHFSLWSEAQQRPVNEQDKCCRPVAIREALHDITMQEHALLFIGFYLHFSQTSLTFSSVSSSKISHVLSHVCFSKTAFRKKKKSCGAIEFPKKPEFSTSQYCCIGSWVSNIWTLGHIQSKSLLLTCSLLGSKHKVSCLKKSQILLKVLASLVFIFKYSIHYHHSTLNYWAILQV